MSDETDLQAFAADLPAETPPQRRGPGRPRGQPHTGGRRKLAPELTADELRQRIARSGALPKLLAIAAGAPIKIGAKLETQADGTVCAIPVTAVPTIAQQKDAAAMLLARLLPELHPIARQVVLDAAAAPIDRAIDAEAVEVSP